VSSISGEYALAELTPQLSAVREAALIRPSADPRDAAVTALLVAEVLAQSSAAEKVGMSAEAVEELRLLARAIRSSLGQLGGEYLSSTARVAADVVARGEGVRATIATALERAIPDDPELGQWLEAIRGGSGVVDLIYDLRTLAQLCTDHAKSTEAAKATLGASLMALSTADALEFAIRMGDPPERTEARDTLARLWTLFVPAYGRAAAAARIVTRAAGEEREFPALALVAAQRRARRSSVSLAPKRSIAPKSTSIPASPNAHDFDAVAISEAEHQEAVEIVRSEPPAPAPATATAATDQEEAAPESRRARRHMVEIEVGIASESNFYLGFTENLSEGGVFVATYLTKPLGSHIEIALAFPNGKQMRVHGVVRWLRSAAADSWPGMGIQFESLTPEDEENIRQFLSLREPLFYDD
jgi:uncharacterized protein (TIGR02266 family)